MEDMRAYLAERPGIFAESINVHFVAMEDSALVVEVMVWHDTRIFREFQDWRDDTLLGLMEIVEKNGSAFAFPTRSIHVESLPSLPGEPPPRAELPPAPRPS
jgi:MscS family membrane protein